MFIPESPFPFTLKSGAVVTDERCTCGSLRSEHENTMAFGHGRRRVGDVITCDKFTWSTWVFTTRGVVPNGFERLDDRHVIKIERANKRNVGAKGYRYDVRDMGAGKHPARLFTCAAPAARSKAQATEHAKIELARHLERCNAQQTIGGAQ